MTPHPNRKMSSTMRAVLEVARARGSLERWPGGFWTYPGCDHRLSKGTLGVSVKVPTWYAGSQTIQALLDRELLEVAEQRRATLASAGFATKVVPR